MWKKIYFRAMTEEEIETYIEYFVKTHLHSGEPISDGELAKDKEWYEQTGLIQGYEHLMILDKKKQHIGYLSYTTDGKFEIMNMEINGKVNSYGEYGKEYFREKFIDYVIYNHKPKGNKTNKKPNVLW